jgi:hypothetical protein
MCMICDGNYDDYTSIIEIYRCDSVTKIPVTAGLKILRIFGCKNVTEIPMIKTLDQLFLVDSMVKTIPAFPALTCLYLTNSKFIETIPDISSLIILSCQNCEVLKTVPKNPPSYIDLSFSRLVMLPKNYYFLGKKFRLGCPWIYPEKDAVKKITKLQRIFKARYNKKKEFFCQHILGDAVLKY